MSSGEEDKNDTNWPQDSESKKRKIQRACDICRRKKIRCDGGQMPRNRCSNCTTYRLNCTYVEAAKKRGPPKGYIEGLENRLEKLEKLLTRICPDIDLPKELELLDVEPPNLASSSVLSSGFAVDMATNAIRGVGSSPPANDYSSDDDDLAQKKLTDRINQLAIDPTHHRFFGKSSGVTLIQTALDLKKEITGNDYDPKALHLKRPEFWNPRPWEQSCCREPPQSAYNYPERDLMTDLVDLYFSQTNVFLPLLHRPTFEKAIADGLHQRDSEFGATLLLVCAIGSQYSDDPRVFLDETDSQHSCGWKWFEQVQVVSKSMLAPPSLYDLQFFSLCVIFLEKSSAPQACWTILGIGIRLAQDVGAHRRKVYHHQLTVEDELWKRAVWVLICMDRLVSTALGRPCAMQDEDFDLELPIECDDEYWEHPDPTMALKQPPGKPSIIAYFNCYLKLNQVLAFALRTIYSINKSRILLGFVGQQWEQHIVAELDSALNKWVDSVPDHLRWDPNRENDTFFSQSVALYASYYHLQILIHRPFIASPRNPSTLSFPSLAICTNAARTCSHVVDVHRKRKLRAMSHVQLSVFSAGIVLLLYIWGGKRSGVTPDLNKEMADVHKCMAVLKECEQRSHSAGRLWDILYELASIGDLPLPQVTLPPTNKRERDSDEPISATPSSATSTLSSSGSPSVPEGPRAIAGSRRVSSAKESSIGSTKLQQQPQQNVQPIFTIPTHSADLEKLPLYGHVNFTPNPGIQHQHQPPHGHEHQHQHQHLPSAVPAPPNEYWYPQGVVHSTGHIPMSSMGSTSTAAAAAAAANLQGLATMPTLFSMEPMYYGPTGMESEYPSRLFGGGQVPTGATTGGGEYQPGGYPDVVGGGGEQEHALTGVDSREGGGGGVGQGELVVDYDTMAMWTHAPTGFELDDWGAYISNVSELIHLPVVEEPSGEEERR